MLRFNLRKLLAELEMKTGRRITLKEVCESSGCDKSVLSRILNQPDKMPSAKVIDDLVLYFYNAFRKFDQRKRDDELIKEIIGKFISVYPMDFDLRELNATEEEIEDFNNMPIEEQWQLYNLYKFGASPEEKEYYGDKPIEIGGGPVWSGSFPRTSPDRKKATKPTKKKS